MVREGTPIDFKLLLLSKSDYEFQWFHKAYEVTDASTRYRLYMSQMENGTSLLTLHIAKSLQRDGGVFTKHHHIFCMPLRPMIGGILFLSCLSFCHSIILSETFTLIITFEQWVLKLWYYTWVFRLTSVSRWNQHFFTLTFEFFISQKFSLNVIHST